MSKIGRMKIPENHYARKGGNVAGIGQPARKRWARRCDRKKRWKSDFEQGVYFDQLLDWQKSTGKGNPSKIKRKRDNSFRLTDKNVDPAIVDKYILLKEATGALYIPK